MLKDDEQKGVNHIKGLVVHVAKYIDGLDRSCEHECRFCIERLEPGHSAEELPTLTLIKDALTSVTAENEDIETVFIAGGEPTKRKDLLEIVSFIKSLGRRVSLTTHGDYPRPDSVARSLKMAGLDSVTVSLHGESAGTHEWHTQRPGSYEHALKSLVAYSRAGFSPRINCVVTSHNIQTLSDMVRFLQDHSQFVIEEVCFAHYTNHGQAFYHPELQFDIKEHAHAITEAIDAVGATMQIRFRDFPLCIDPRLAKLDLSVDNLGVLKWNRFGSAVIIPEKAPVFWRAECGRCRLRCVCPGYLLANYGHA